MTQVTDEMMKAFMSECAIGGHARGLQRLFDAKLISLPVNEAKVRESVVREAQALFDHDDEYLLSWTLVNKRLQSLLPAKDRAEELADDYFRGRVYNIEMYTDTVDAFRWLIEREGV